jgi:hypothetical protein
MQMAGRAINRPEIARGVDWIAGRNRLGSVESNNQHQITQILDVIQRTVDFRIARVCWNGPYIASFSPPV